MDELQRSRQRGLVKIKKTWSERRRNVDKFILSSGNPSKTERITRYRQKYPFKACLTPSDELVEKNTWKAMVTINEMQLN